MHGKARDMPPLLNFYQLYTSSGYIKNSFFDYLHMLFEVDVIIAPFILPDQPYIPPCYNEQYANNMHIMYTEIQICLMESAQDLIKEKTVHVFREGEQYEK